MVRQTFAAMIDRLEPRVLFASYGVTDLGTLGGSSAVAYAMNVKGQIVGRSATRAGTEHAFLHSGGAMRDLGTLGGSRSIAFAVNDAGQVVGMAQRAGGVDRAFLYANGSMRDLGSLGGGRSSAFSINTHGHVVGSATTSSGKTHAFRHSNGAMRDLGTLPGGTTSAAYGINDYGHIVGIADRNGADHGFLYADGVMRDLGVLAGTNFAHAFGINEVGQAVGEVKSTGGQTHAGVFAAGGVRDLGTLAGGRYSKAFTANNFGQTVGVAHTSAGAQRAFLYSAHTGGSLQDLNSLMDQSPGRRFTEANFINDRGQIVGYGLNAAGQTRAFLLTPKGLGSIAGTTFHDRDGDRVRDSNESGLSGRQVYLDVNGNGRRDPGEASVTTGSAGTYRFGSLPPGTYVVRQVTPSGRQVTTPSGGAFRIVLAVGQATAGKDFGSR